MSYGSYVKRKPAEGSKGLTDANINKIGLMGATERGVAGIQTGIYDFSAYSTKCGLYGSSKYAGVVAKSFFDTLLGSVQVEMKVLPFVASDSVQATDEIMDGAGTPVKIFDIKAGLKNVADKSAFGNKIAWKSTQTFNMTYKLTTDSGATPTTLVLNTVDNLEIGYYFKIADGTNTEYAVITDIATATKTITFAALTNTYTAALTTVYRADWKLQVALKDFTGAYQEVEKWVDVPFAVSDTLGMPLLTNHVVSGSNYVVVTHNASNSSAAGDNFPADVTTWTALSSGSDGTAATDSDWNTLVADFVDEDFMILLAPESTSKTHNGNMTTWTTTNENACYYAQAANEASEATLTDFGATLRGSIKFGMLPTDKWFEIENPEAVGKRSIPAVGHLAAHFFNSVSLYGLKKVAAGWNYPINTNDELLDDNGLVHDNDSGSGGILITDYSVNLARKTKGVGTTINSARTFSSDAGYQYQNQIMGWLFIKKSFLPYLQSIEQEPAGVNPQEQHLRDAKAFFIKHYKAGLFFEGQKVDGSKTTFEDVVMIKNDFSVNTLADIQAGIERIIAQVIFTPVIETPGLELASAAVTTVRA